MIADSRIRRILHGALCLLSAASLYSLSRKGYPLLALALLPAVVLCCWQLAAQRLAGAAICWQRGEWLLQQGPGCRAISIDPRSTCLSWLVYLAWSDVASERRGAVFLFADSAAPDQLRQLRVRLTLER